MGMWKNKLASCVPYTKQQQNIYAKHFKLPVHDAAQSYSKVNATQWLQPSTKE